MPRQIAVNIAASAMRITDELFFISSSPPFSGTSQCRTCTAFEQAAFQAYMCLQCFPPSPVFLFMGLFFILLRAAVALFCPGEKEDREQIFIVIHSLLARFQGRTECVVTGTTSPYCFTWRLAIWRPLL
jgi:hypothetical protein